MGFPNWPYPYYPCEDPQERSKMDDDDQAFYEWKQEQEEEEYRQKQAAEEEQRAWRGLFGEIFLFDGKNPIAGILKWLFGGK